MSEADPVSHESKLLRIRHNQEFALELIIGSQPDPALSILDKIDKDVQDCEGSLEWARQPFLVARAYALDNHRVAESFYKDAIERESKLSTSDSQHSFLLHKSYGRYLFGKKKFRSALKEYEFAERVGMVLGPSEELAHLHIRIIATKYQISDNQVQARNLELFRKVAVERQCTFVHQHRAWLKHERSVQNAATEAAFMRDTGLLDVAYFRHLLDSTRDDEVETESAKSE